MDYLEELWLFYQKVVIELLKNQTTASKFIEDISKVMFGEKTLTDDELVYLYEKVFELKSTNDIELVENKKEDYNKIIEAFKKMSNIQRTGWIVRSVPEEYRENDAMHIMQMFALAYTYFKLDKTINLNKRKVYEMIIIHEIGESIIGDIREGTNAHKKKHELEITAVKTIFMILTNKDYFITLWNDFENKESSEAYFVYQLDKIDPILKAKILDKILNRTDLYDDFYNFEIKRQTYEKGKVKELFNYSRKMEVNII